MRFGAEADRFAVMDVEPALGDQHLVDNGVEVAVVVGVIDVAVHVVVLPARSDNRLVRVGGLVGWGIRWLGAHGDLKLPAERAVPTGRGQKTTAPRLRAGTPLVSTVLLGGRHKGARLLLALDCLLEGAKR